MKLDARKRKTMAARRTLKILTLALTQLLQVKPFEKISVIDICEKALVPRAPLKPLPYKIWAIAKSKGNSSTPNEMFRRIKAQKCV